LVQGITGPFFGAVIQGISGVTAGLIIAFSASWQLTLVILGLIPGKISTDLSYGLCWIPATKSFDRLWAKVTRRYKDLTEAYEMAGQTACEAIGSVRTVLTLTQEKTFTDQFEKHCELPHKLTVTGGRWSAITFAFAQAVPFISWGVAFYYGSRLIVWQLYGSKEIIQSIFAIIFTSMAAGQINNHTPDAAKAKNAAKTITELLDRNSQINVTSNSGETSATAEGQANVTGAHFSYPTRPGIKILNGLEVEAMPGKTVALVGQSGCGKYST
jgi:ABC-type multidrug transport system fused ATPase/permease subunit